MSEKRTKRPLYRTLKLSGLAIALLLVLAGGTIGFLHVMNTGAKTNNAAQATSTANALERATAYTATASALVSATTEALRALQSPYPPYGGSLVLNDPLHDNSKGYKWGLDTDDGTCRFRHNAYYIDIPESDYVEYCKASATHFSNFAFQVQMTITKGDRGGLTFLVNDAQKTLYYFGIGQDGSYVLDYFKGEQGTNLLKGNANTLIHTGLNQPNVVAVVVIGHDAALYVNMQLITHATNIIDSPDSAIGLAAQDKSNSTEVVFNNAKVWSFQQ